MLIEIVLCYGLIVFSRLFACLQRVFYFPLKEKLKALLKTPSFRSMIQHECKRPRPHKQSIMYDIFDAPAWKKFMGPCTYPNKRIGLSCFTLLLVCYCDTSLSSLVPKLTSLSSLCFHFLTMYFCIRNTILCRRDPCVCEQPKVSENSTSKISVFATCDSRQGRTPYTCFLATGRHSRDATEEVLRFRG